MDCHTVVVGLGAVGSAVLYQLADRGCEVVGIDQYSPPHALGSSCGESRITRLAIAEGDPYVQLVRRSHAIWRQIEDQLSTSLVTATGGLLISPNQSDYFQRTVQAARREGITHEVLSSADMAKAFPQFNVEPNDRAYYEPDAGILRPERCIEAQITLALRLHAEIRFNQRVVEISEIVGGARVTTERSSITTKNVVLAVGPWLGDFLDADLSRQFTVYRQVQFWFSSKDPSVHMPVFIWELDGVRKGIYGLPGIDASFGTVKIASEQYETLTCPNAIERNITPSEIDAIRTKVVESLLPNLSGECRRTAACMYTMTPDSNFVIDRLPSNCRLLVASPCSGHGFKHSAAVGEAIAELVMTGTSTIDLAAFRLSRFVP